MNKKDNQNLDTLLLELSKDIKENKIFDINDTLDAIKKIDEDSIYKVYSEMLLTSDKGRALEATRHVNNLKMTQIIIDYLKNEKPDYKMQALHALKNQNPSELKKKFLFEYINNPSNEYYQEYAITALKNKPDKETMEFLLKFIENQNNKDLSIGVAMEVFRENLSEDIANHLFTYISKKDYKMKDIAILTLTYSKNNDVINKLIEYLKNISNTLRIGIYGFESQRKRDYVMEYLENTSNRSTTERFRSMFRSMEEDLKDCE